MENLDIIILTSILSTLFVVFGIVVYKEFKKMESEEWRKNNAGNERGPRADFVNFVGNLFDEGTTKKMNHKQREIMYQAVKRTISDMESDGVYFPKEVKEELARKREEMICEYSGLRSVASYTKEN